jgi:hypothetical protein
MKQIKKQAKIGMLILVFLIALATPTFAEYPSCCCYSNTVSVVRSDSDYGYCIENGGSIISGAAQTYQQCVDTCGLNACSNCKAEQCSAYDNCNANPSGGLCASGETCCSGACTMKQGPGQGCENPNLAIKPTNLGRGNDQGYKRVSLSWDNNYVCPASSYDILRCLGASCTPAVSISTTSQKSFVDSGVEWGNTYRYIIKGNYPSQGQKSSEILTVYTGDSTCDGHTNDAAFCVGNERATCSLSNTLTKTTCPSNQICVGGACISSSNCNEDSGNPFGEYYNIFNCE